MQPSQIAAMQRVLFASYPTVTAINIADILDTIRHVAEQITLVIRFLAGFSILSGVVILGFECGEHALSASTRGRGAEGAGRNTFAHRGCFSVEFVTLGLLAGLAGAVFADALSRILLHVAEIPFVSDPVAEASAVLLTTVLAVATGWVASYRILGQKPLEVLREE